MANLEIYPIEKYVEKIEKHLDEVADSKRNMYSKTKKRYHRLAVILLKCVNKIIKILETDSLSNVDDNVDIDVTEISYALDDTNSAMNNLESFVPKKDKLEKETITNINKYTFAKYREIIEKSTQISYPYKEVTQCAEMIDIWFKNRFLSGSRNFRYKIDQLPEWIFSMILLYGKHVKHQTQDRLVDNVVNWSVNAKEDSSNKYAVPYEVYEIQNSTNSSDFTLEAVLIGDILMDSIYYKLNSTNCPELICNIDGYPVASIVKSKTVDADLLSELRTRIAYRDELCRECNFTEEVESDV